MPPHANAVGLKNKKIYYLGPVVKPRDNKRFYFNNTNGINMIIIGFTGKTSKILPQIFCHKFRHVAVIVPVENILIMYQFVHRKKIVKIQLKMRDLKILLKHGWTFIYLPGKIPHGFENIDVWTCVQLAKQAIGIHAAYIQTPYILYRRLKSLEF